MTMRKQGICPICIYCLDHYQYHSVNLTLRISGVYQMFNYAQDNNVLTKSKHSNINVGMLNFQPMPKRFMVWDKKQENFIVPENCDTRKWLYIEELAIFMHQLGIGGFGDETRSRYIIVQSTNLFDKDGKEIWEGSIVDYNDDGEALGIVVGIDGQWQLKDKNYNLMFLIGGPHQKLVGHILSNPELSRRNNHDDN